MPPCDQRGLKLVAPHSTINVQDLSAPVEIVWVCGMGQCAAVGTNHLSVKMVSNFYNSNFYNSN